MDRLVTGCGLLIVYGPCRQWLPCAAEESAAVLEGWRSANPDAARWGDLTAVFGEVVASEFTLPGGDTWSA